MRKGASAPGRGYIAYVEQRLGSLGCACGGRSEEAVLTPALQGGLGQTYIQEALLGPEIITVSSHEAAADSWPKADGQGVMGLARPAESGASRFLCSGLG